MAQATTGDDAISRSARRRAGAKGLCFRAGRGERTRNKLAARKEKRKKKRKRKRGKKTTVERVNRKSVFGATDCDHEGGPEGDSYLRLQSRQTDGFYCYY